MDSASIHLELMANLTSIHRFAKGGQEPVGSVTIGSTLEKIKIRSATTERCHYRQKFLQLKNISKTKKSFIWKFSTQQEMHHVED